MPRSATVAILAVVTAGLLMTGCAAEQPASKDEKPVGSRMAGPVQKIVISKKALASRPQPWVLKDPASAVRSYLDWTSYAYRVAESAVATPTMTPQQEVKIDSYVQLNLQKTRLLDQRLTSLVLGEAVVTADRAIVPAKEAWSYRYVSISEADKTVGGPYTASYETTYTLVKNDKAEWVVDAITVKALGEVK